MRKPVLYLCSAALTIAIYGCGGNENGAVEVKSMGQLHEENGVPVRTEVVEPGIFETTYTYHSVLTGVEETSAAAMLSDKVEKINFKVGDHVRKDTVVITFPTDNPAAQYFQSKVAFEHAETTLGRIRSLYENGGISLQEYDNAKTQFEVSKANWETVQQTVTVEAPISGILTNLAVRESDNVNPGDILFTISKTEKLKTRLWISEGQIADIHVGNTATASWQGKTLGGSVVQVDMSLDDKQQAFGAVIEFDNPGMNMMSGVNAEVVIHGKRNDNTVITARKNILWDDESWYVFVAQNDVAVRREVSLGRSRGIDIEITGGLNPGDTLITEGQSLLEDNTNIRVIN